MSKKGQSPTEKQLAALAAGRAKNSPFVKGDERAVERGRNGGIKSGKARRMKAAARLRRAYAPAKKLKREISVELGDTTIGEIVLTGYETENDLIRAETDVQRMLAILAECTLYELAGILAPYRKERFDEQLDSGGVQTINDEGGVRKCTLPK